MRVLADRVFQDTRTPLTVWFEAAWLMGATKNGVSAASLQPLLGLGSYETAWAMCHKLRTAMGRTSTDLLSCNVEVDETFIGGVKTGGKRGRGAPGKAYDAIAVEAKVKGFGRFRLQVVEKIDAKHLGECMHRNLSPGSVVVSDALPSYPLAITDTFEHKSFNIKRFGLPAHELLPGVHWAASLLKRWPVPTNPEAPPSTCRPTWMSSPFGSTAVMLVLVGAVPSALGGRRARGADADAGTDQGPEPTPRRDAPTSRAEVAQKPCSRVTRPPMASRRPV